jgi:2-methylisocitrate lyase-like PEP mutase family enzyme
LLGHSQATSARYAHLDNDPLRRASDAIANKIAAAPERNQKAPVISIARNGVG